MAQIFSGENTGTNRKISPIIEAQMILSPELTPNDFADSAEILLVGHVAAVINPGAFTKLLADTGGHPQFWGAMSVRTAYRQV